MIVEIVGYRKHLCDVNFNAEVWAATGRNASESEVQSQSGHFATFLKFGSVSHVPVELQLVVVVFELLEHQFLEDLLEGDHAGGLVSAFLHDDGEVDPLLLELLDGVQ